MPNESAAANRPPVSGSRPPGAPASRRSLPRRFFGQPVYDALASLERLADTKRPGLLMFGMLAIGCITWFIYVPIHELSHVAGCVLAGGEVHQLELQPRYGGRILARVFPWVVADSDYAGQLTGFDTKGSDLIYHATDFGPFLLTVFLGVPLIKLCTRRARPILFPIAIVLGMAPFYNLTGDYYEMGSIMTTRAATWVVGPNVAQPPPPGEDESRGVILGGETDAAFAGLRSDDIFSLFADFFLKPSRRGISGVGHFAAGFLIILISLALSVFLAFLTYWAGHLFSRVVLPRPPSAS